MKYDNLIPAVNAILDSYAVALTLRQIFYRLVSRNLIKNTRSAYTQLSSQLVTAREKGDVDEIRMVDRSRTIISASYASPADFIDTCKRSLTNRYLYDYWKTQPYQCEIWVEKDALSEIVSSAVYEYNIVVAPAKGYSSYSYLKTLGERLTGPAVILYLGDHDPSGLQMAADLQRRLALYYGNIFVKRIGLTFDQIKQCDMIPNPVKITDPRAKDYIAKYGDRCFELDALDPALLTELCRNEVKKMITRPDKWEELKTKDGVATNNLMKQFQMLSTTSIQEEAE